MEPTPTLIAVPWKPSVASSVWMTVASTVIALVADVLAFVLAFRGREGTITFDLVGVVIAVGIIVVSVVAHEGVHGLAILAYGGRPTFGAGIASKVLPW